MRGPIEFQNSTCLVLFLFNKIAYKAIYKIHANKKITSYDNATYVALVLSYKITQYTNSVILRL